MRQEKKFRDGGTSTESRTVAIQKPRSMKTGAMEPVEGGEIMAGTVWRLGP